MSGRKKISGRERGSMRKSGKAKVDKKPGRHILDSGNEKGQRRVDARVEIEGKRIQQESK